MPDAPISEAVAGGSRTTRAAKGGSTRTLWLVLILFATISLVGSGCGEDADDRIAGTSAPAASARPTAGSKPIAAGAHRIVITSSTLQIEANQARLGALLDELGRRTGIAIEATPAARETKVDVAIESAEISGALPSLLRGLDFGVWSKSPDDGASPPRLARLSVGALQAPTTVRREREVESAEIADIDDDVDDDDDTGSDLDELPLADRLSLIERGSRQERVAAIRATEPDGAGLAAMVHIVEADGDPVVRAAAAAQLEDTSDFAGVRALIVALGDSDTRVVRAAIESLEFAGDESVIRHLEPLLSHPNPDVRKDASDAIEFLRD